MARKRGEAGPVARKRGKVGPVACKRDRVETSLMQAWGGDQ